MLLTIIIGTLCCSYMDTCVNEIRCHTSKVVHMTKHYVVVLSQPCQTIDRAGYCKNEGLSNDNNFKPNRRHDCHRKTLLTYQSASP